jgi:hypothetical protein
MDGKIGKMESAFEISMVWKMEAFFGGCVVRTMFPSID